MPVAANVTSRAKIPGHNLKTTPAEDLTVHTDLTVSHPDQSSIT